MFGLLRRLISMSLKLAVLAAGIGAIIGYANLSDVDGWKSDLEDQVMRVSGRRIIAEGIRLQNAKWGARRDMLKARRLVAEVDFLPLMLGDVAVPRLRLEGVEILVEVTRSGKTNWDDLNSLKTASGGATSGTISPGGVSVLGGQVTVSDAATGATTAFNLPNLDLGLGAAPCF